MKKSPRIEIVQRLLDGKDIIINQDTYTPPDITDVDWSGAVALHMAVFDVVVAANRALELFNGDDVEVTENYTPRASTILRQKAIFEFLDEYVETLTNRFRHSNVDWKWQYCSHPLYRGDKVQLHGTGIVGVVIGADEDGTIVEYVRIQSAAADCPIYGIGSAHVGLLQHIDGTPVGAYLGVRPQGQ